MWATRAASLRTCRPTVTPSTSSPPRSSAPATPRAPTSLSGGETFLVSLALALALSDTIQLGSAPLEFFFLDEGFGTLDGELLDSVLTSLEHLRSQHRAIGVITHVGALRERIARGDLGAMSGRGYLDWDEAAVDAARDRMIAQLGGSKAVSE